MLISPRELVTSAYHRLLGLERVLKSRRREHFVEKQRQNGVILHPVSELSRQYVNCPQCGYVMVALQFSDVRVETCSAFLLRDMIENPSFTNYVNRLSKSSEPATRELTR